jgi:L-asparagine oxygenase
MRFDPFLVTAIDSVSAAANTRLVQALVEADASHAVDVVLRAGDLLVFQNYRVLHRRVAFTPLPAARSRWLRRFYGARTLARRRDG